MDISGIVSLLERGEVVILPTDTLHALSCDATNDAAVQKLIEIKGRKENHPLPVLVRDLEQALTIGVFNDTALEFANKYWGGALTIVLPLRKDAKISQNIYGNFKSVALRMPRGKIINEILNQFNKPIVGTSANISGRPNLLTKQELIRDFEGRVSSIMFEENLLSIPSTIVDCTLDVPKLIRQGAIKI